MAKVATSVDPRRKVRELYDRVYPRNCPANEGSVQKLLAPVGMHLDDNVVVRQHLLLRNLLPGRWRLDYDRFRIDRLRRDATALMECSNVTTE